MKSLDGQVFPQSPMAQTMMPINLNATTELGTMQNPGFNNTAISPLNNTLLAGVSTPGQSHNSIPMQHMMLAQS